MDKKHKLLGNFEKIVKIFDENSIEKLNFIIFIGNMLLKIEPSEITQFFYNNVSAWGGGFPPTPPKSAYDIGRSACWEIDFTVRRRTDVRKVSGNW